ncbi:MAG: methyl-accepting chemotaxis protein [Acetobacteraceae bacterium]
MSGFSEEELLGAPHNLVRHPHMPQQAFADLWKTIKAGRPWDGLVKNRTKSGDFYWVRANVTPVITDGEITGFISIRSKPTKEQTDKAEKSYAALRNGTAKGIALRDGELVASSVMTSMAEFGRSVAGRLSAAVLASVLALMLVAWLGFAGMSASNGALQHVYEREFVAVNQLRTLNDSVRDNRNHIAQMAIALGRETPLDAVLREREIPVRANLAKIESLWKSYVATGMIPEQRPLAEAFRERFDALVQNVIEPAFALAKSGEIAKLNTLFEQKAPPFFVAVFNANKALVEAQIEAGRIVYDNAESSLRWRVIAGGIIFLFSVIAISLLGWALFRTIRHSAAELESHFGAIIRGDLAAEIPRPKVREFYQVTSMLRAMRAHLAFASWERTEFEHKAAEVRRQTVEQMAHTIEEETGTAVARIAERTGEMARDADSMAASAERTSTSSAYVANSADQALKNAQVVAAASEELAAAINEVASQVEHASNVARAATEKGEHAQETIRSLSQAAEHIGAVVRLIADIAAKTNLLALNATIEAARAGEAGKGFAVVAGEVKGLAAQTAKATEEISQHIGGLRGATEAAVTAVDDIGHTLHEVAQIAISVATAVEQQTAATQEIARNVAESSAAVQDVTTRIGDVSAEAGVTGTQAGELRGKSGAVVEDIASLRSALVRIVRTASKEADRRMEPRIQIEEPCSVLFGRNGALQPATLFDASMRGAAIRVTNGQNPTETQGVLVLDRRGGGRVRFDIRSADRQGVLHVQFDKASMTPGFEQALQSLLNGQATQRLHAAG